MKKTKITVTNFGKIVEEISTGKFDCSQTHIFIFKKPSKEIENYLLSIARTAPADKIHSYMIHLDDCTKNILEYFGEE